MTIIAAILALAMCFASYKWWEAQEALKDALKGWDEALRLAEENLTVAEGMADQFGMWANRIGLQIQSERIN